MAHDRALDLTARSGYPPTMSPDKPHDALFRFAFSNLTTARSHFQEVLPAELVVRINWSTLAPCPGSFVDEELKGVHSDLVFKVMTDDGQPLRLFILLEHQSSPDPLMPFRILRYMVRIWDEQLRADPPERLAVIVPLVLYHGADRWTVPANLLEMMRLGPSDAALLGRYIPAFEHEVQDLSHVPDAAIRGDALRQMSLLLFKHARDGDLWERMPAWLGLLREIDREPDGLRAVVAVLRYILRVSTTGPDPDIQAAIRKTITSTKEDLLMTWAEQLRAEGIKQGIEQGIGQGIERGLERAREVLYTSIVDVLAARTPDLDQPRLVTSLRSLPLDTLQAALRIAITATNLAEFETKLAQIHAVS